MVSKRSHAKHHLHCSMYLALVHSNDGILTVGFSHRLAVAGDDVLIVLLSVGFSKLRKIISHFFVTIWVQSFKKIRYMPQVICT